MKTGLLARRLNMLGYLTHISQYEGENICAAFHPQEYINRTLPACGFQIIDMVPGDSVKFAHQDTYLAKKR